jgi:hypothetical protein
LANPLSRYDALKWFLKLGTTLGWSDLFEFHCCNLQFMIENSLCYRYHIKLRDYRYCLDQEELVESLTKRVAISIEFEYGCGSKFGWFPRDSFRPL